ncbi:MAG TPA: cytochrome c biogenesis heme-transporting ATPase CcmA [Rhizobacter sp.]|nr:cytochrome c biogenesis heme-transporting ATPase CcmA [Rhizobacter sp.]
MLTAALPTLATTDLACRRGDRVLFKGLQLELPPGQVTWLRGANGRGKTSLLRLLAGLSTPEAGHVQWSGSPRQRVYIAHANALKEDLTALESLRFLARLHGREDSDATLTGALRQFGVAHRRHAFVRTVSQGQRRRVALSRLALDTQPTLWILDEPFDALDTDGIATLNALLTQHAQRGGSVVLTSHQALTLTQPVPRVVQLDEVTV